MSTETTVGELTIGHTGRRITVEVGTTTISGLLYGLDVTQQWVSEKGTTDLDSVEIPTTRTISLNVGGWVSLDLPESTPVTLE